MKSLLAILALTFATHSFANCYQVKGEAPEYVPQKICVKKDVKDKTIVLVSSELGEVEVPTTKTLYMTSEQYYILSEGIIYDNSEVGESCGRQHRIEARFSGFVLNDQLRDVGSILTLVESFERDTCHGTTKYTTYSYEQI